MNQMISIVVLTIKKLAVMNLAVLAVVGVRTKYLVYVLKTQMSKMTFY